MSRINYYEGDDYTQAGRWEGALKSSLNGKRGQGALRTLLAALEALPSKRLIAGALSDCGEVCAIGALCAYETGKRDGLSWTEAIDAYDGLGVDDIYETVAQAETYGFSYTLAWTVAQMNDEFTYATPEDRYETIVEWLKGNIKQAA